MIQVLLATNDDRLAAGLTTAIGPNFRRVSPVNSPVTGEELLSPLGSPLPHIVVLDAAGHEEHALALAQQLQESHRIATILVTPRAAELALPALRAGVRDLVTPDVDAAEIRIALDRTARALEPTAPDPVAPPGPSEEGTIVAVVSPKGGVGKTTVATNLAVGLNGRFAQSTVLVDLDVHFGDCASALNLDPQHTLPDIARGPASRDSIAVKSYLTEHVTGLYVIPGSDDPAAADAVTAEDIARLLRLLRSQFRYVVVDTAPGLSEHTLAVLDVADSLVMVTSLDVPGVRGLRKEIDTLTDLHLLPGERHIVLNFNDASRGLSVADVEATIRARVDVVLPQTNVVPLSINQGIPLLQSGGRDPIVQRLAALVELVAPTPGAPKRGLFGRRRH